MFWEAELILDLDKEKEGNRKQETRRIEARLTPEGDGELRPPAE